MSLQRALKMGTVPRSTSKQSEWDADDDEEYEEEVGDEENEEEDAGPAAYKAYMREKQARSAGTQLPSSNRKSGGTSDPMEEVISRLGSKAEDIRVHDAKVVDYCVKRLLDTADGGEACLDQGIEPGVAFHTVPPGSVLPAWRKVQGEWGDDFGPKERGFCEWAVPEGAEETCRVLFITGGVNIYYSPADGYRPLSSRLAQCSGMPVFVPDFRKAPSQQYPKALEDCLAALEYAAGHNHKGEASPATHVFVVGDSSGGGLAMATLLAARDSGAVDFSVVAGGVSVSGWLDQTSSSSSYESRKFNKRDKSGDPIFCCGSAKEEREGTMEMALTYVGGDKAKLRDPLVSPLFAETLAGLPPLLLQCGNAEVVLADTTRFADRCHEDGVQVTLEVWPRMWHDWIMYTEGCGGSAPHLLREGELALDHIANFVRQIAGLHPVEYVVSPQCL